MGERARTPAASLKNLTDAELAEQVATGARGPSAETELYSRFAPRVRLYGRRHLRSDDAAADLVQRVMIATLEKLRSGEVREPERIGSFVLGTARLTAREIQRKVSRETPLEAHAESLVGSSGVPRDSMASERLRDCFESLGDRERTVLVATYFGELSTDSIARPLGTSTRNVRQIRHRAVEQLRACVLSPAKEKP